MKNSTYDFWKKVAMYVLPGLATFVSTVFEIWNIPYGVGISRTIMAFDTLLCIILGISTIKYNNSTKVK